jgi:hypothetical protein
MSSTERPGNPSDDPRRPGKNSAGECLHCLIMQTITDWSVDSDKTVADIVVTLGEVVGHVIASSPGRMRVEDIGQMYQCLIDSTNHAYHSYRERMLADDDLDLDADVEGMTRN